MRLLTVSWAMAAIACGGGSDPSAGAYRRSASELRAAIVSYRESPDSSAPSTCPAQAQRYGELARGHLASMREHMAQMSGCMESHHSMCDAMMGELDRHGVAACTSNEVSDRAEVLRHCAAMIELVDREMAAVGDGTRPPMSPMMMGGQMRCCCR